MNKALEKVVKEKISLLKDFGVVTRKNREIYTSLLEKELSPVANDKGKLRRKADCLAESIILEALI